MEALGLTRLDVCSSPSLGSASVLAEHGGVDAETAAAAWRLLEAGDTLCIAQVESLGMRQLFRRARELRDQHGVDGGVLARLEDLAQLLALWRPGAWGKEREQAYLDARFAGVRPNYLHPSMSRVLASTYGQLVYVDQLVAVIKLLGFEHGWAERFRRTIVGGRRAAERNDMERLLRAAAAKRGWTEGPRMTTPHCRASSTAAPRP